MKEDVFKRFNKDLASEGFTFVRTDFNRPWGGFFVIEESQAPSFIQKYFPNESYEVLTKDGGRVSPKILVVAPNKRLSWQYHNRRSEVWIVTQGEVGVVRSCTDKEGDMIVHTVGDKIELEQGERHRLVGLDDYSVLAEIWQHTDPDCLSDEDDIVRVQDDFGR